MSDLESGLKQAVESATRGQRGRNLLAEATAIHGNHGDSLRPFIISGGQEPRPAMTAPAIIETIMELTKQAHALDSLAWELSDALAGGADKVPLVSPPGNEPAMSIFDRMGLGLLELTRAIESIDRNVKRSLAAVKP